MHRENLNQGIINALVRCTRPDDLAATAFELVREDLGLWVMELDVDCYTASRDVSGGIEAIFNLLDPQREFLRSLSSGSSDYALHIEYQGNDGARLVLPPTLSQLAGYCGFAVEIYRSESE